ncbi:MAG: hypothetical protein HY869_16860 [Chloroflexi bacterium]|nr:hypothetical protein [Chloroflexota bacterium]
MGLETRRDIQVTRIVVCDTGPLLHLSEAGCVNLLEAAGDILIPREVANEFKRNSQNLALPNWIKVTLLENNAASQASRLVNDEIDLGEAEAIVLAQQVQADWLLSDDGRARRFAEAQGLEVHGSIGVLLWAAANDQIPTCSEAHQLLKTLSESSLWVSENVLQKAHQAIDVLMGE